MPSSTSMDAYSSSRLSSEQAISRRSRPRRSGMRANVGWTVAQCPRTDSRTSARLSSPSALNRCSSRRASRRTLGKLCRRSERLRRREGHSRTHALRRRGWRDGSTNWRRRLNDSIPATSSWTNGSGLETASSRHRRTCAISRRNSTSARLITLLSKDFLRILFVLERFKRRPDLEQRMDWGQQRARVPSVDSSLIDLPRVHQVPWTSASVSQGAAAVGQ